jgi:hypothetical protein
MALERMLGKPSTRRYGLGLEPVGEQTTQVASQQVSDLPSVRRRDREGPG